MSCTLAIDLIRLDFQRDANLIDETVADYIERMHKRAPVAPVTVRYDGRHYWLQRGFHRVATARRLARRGIEADVFPGTREDMEPEWQECLAAIRGDLRQEQ
jgi:hypothetical protein